ncbi:MAG TPA: cupin domain-containing protein [Casimicrobiaceae bacterium]
MSATKGSSLTAWVSLAAWVVALTLLGGAGGAAAQARGPETPHVASGSLASLTEAPRYVELLRVAVGPGTEAHLAVGDGIVYLLSGHAAIGMNGASADLAPGDGRFAARGQDVTITGTGPGEAVILAFLLLRRDELARSATQPAVAATRIFRARAPISGVEPGAYDVDLRKVTFPARTPSNAPHHRTGAALYYVLDGTGANTIGRKVWKRRRGSIVYEPTTVVHQWGNPGKKPLELLIFDIHRSGTPAVVRAEAPVRR